MKFICDNPILSRRFCAMNGRRRHNAATVYKLMGAITGIVISAGTASATSTSSVTVNNNPTLINGNINLNATATYSNNKLPGTAVDVVFPSTTTYSPATFDIAGASLSYGALLDDTTQTLTITNGNGSAGTLTLNNTALTTTDTFASSGDQLYVASGGTLNINNGSGGSLTLNISKSNGNYDVAGTGVLNIGAGVTIGGAQNIAETGSGTINIAGTINSTLNLFITKGSGTTTLSGGVSSVLLQFDGSGLTTVSGVVSGATVVSTQAADTGISALTNANTYTGGTTVSAATLIGTNVSSFGEASAGLLNISGGTLDLYNNSNAGAGSSGQTIVFGALSTPGGYATSINGGGIKVGNLGNYTGVSDTTTTGNTVQLGTLSANGINTFTNSNAYNLAFGAVTSTSTAQFVNNLVNGTLTLASFTDTSNGSGIIRFNSSSGNGVTVVSGTIGTTGGTNGTGTTSVQQIGGTTILTGANTYAPNTTITGGTLVANTTGPIGTSNSATGTSAVNISGGTLAGGSKTAIGYISGTVTLSTATSVITAGAGSNVNSVGTLSTGAQNWSSGTYVAKVGTGNTNDELIMSGLNNSTGTFTVNINGVGSSDFSQAATFIIADDTGNGNDGGVITTASPFNLSSITFTASGNAVAAYNAGQLTLTETPDGPGMGAGEYLEVIDSGSTAAPEPTSLLLLGAVVSPVMLRRRIKRPNSA